MKTGMVSLAPVVLLVICFTGCPQRTVLEDLPTQDIRDQVAKGHVWTVEEFEDDGNKYTPYFDGRTFDFTDDGCLTTEDNQGNSYTDAWIIDEDDTPVTAIL